MEGHALNNSDHLAVNMVLEMDKVSLAPTLRIEAPRIRWDKMSKQDRENRYKDRLEHYVVQILDETTWDAATP